MIRRGLWVSIVVLGLHLTPVRGGVVCERWGGRSKALTHPGMLKVVVSGQTPRAVFDLSAIPKGATVYHASLYGDGRGGQPRQPIDIRAVARLDAEGKPVAAGGPLKLEPPWYRSFDATAAVRAWVKDPAANLGFQAVRVGGFDFGSTVLEVLYEGKPSAKIPPQVDGLKVIHHHGQTFLTWRELPLFRPDPSKIVWIDDYADADKAVAGPGTGKMGNPRVPGLRLGTLRVDLQGLKVRTTPGRGQAMPPFERIRALPEIRYRIYRHDKPITAANFAQAACVGEAAPMAIYDWRMLKIYSQGEYYNKHERADNVIGTFCIEDHKGVLPGYDLYVHTPAADGKAYYAVTAMKDGTENTAVSAANSLAKPIAEKVRTPVPLKYYVVNSTLRGKSDKATVYEYLFWATPPFANLPDNRPKHVGIAVAADYKAPGPLLVNLGRAWAEQRGAIMLAVEPAGDLCYIDGRGTLKSYAESKLEYYPEKYFFHVVNWALKQWKVDPARISGVSGLSLHLAIRHPEIFGVFFPNRPNYFENDFDQKWNPASRSLPGRIGPPDLVKAPDGKSPGWDVFDMTWYLAQDPGKDVPFMVCLFTQPKDGNHGAEYGWQDDPKGWAALRDVRQPYVAQWGGGGIAREVRAGLYGLRWDKSVPAFSNGSLDNNPGNGDPDDGEPWGQINGYLFWDYASIVDKPDRWEMTVSLVASSPEDACTVDVTPRHRKAFNPKPGTIVRWTNAPMSGGQAASGTAKVDKFGLVTLKRTPVTKGKNRIVITTAD